MTKTEFLKLLDSAIDGRKGFSFKCTGVGAFRVYRDDDIFTACFLSDVLEYVGSYFNGITVDCDGKPYLSFNY